MHSDAASATQQDEPRVVACPHCGGQMTVNRELAGQDIACPHCQNVIAAKESQRAEAVSSVADDSGPGFSCAVKFKPVPIWTKNFLFAGSGRITIRGNTAALAGRRASRACGWVNLSWLVLCIVGGICRPAGVSAVEVSVAFWIALLGGGGLLYLLLGPKRGVLTFDTGLAQSIQRKRRHIEFQIPDELGTIRPVALKTLHDESAKVVEDMLRSAVTAARSNRSGGPMRSKWSVGAEEGSQPLDTEPGPTTGAATTQDGQKLCPYCGETIKAIATKCKHCGEFLERASRQQSDRAGRLGLAEWVCAIIFPWLGIMVGVAWAIQRKKKAGKMIVVSCVFFILHLVCIIAANRPPA
jgi:ssDNA-binding Zn-finger/Zn-ribbon topoisomerase 1